MSNSGITPIYQSITGDLNVVKITFAKYPKISSFKYGGTKEQIESVGYNYEEIKEFICELRVIIHNCPNYIYNAIHESNFKYIVGHWYNTGRQDRDQCMLLDAYSEKTINEIQSDLDEMNKTDKNGKTKIERYTEKYQQLLKENASKEERVKQSIKTSKLMLKKAFLTGLLQQRKYYESELAKMEY
jgi:hypothetical protein